MRRITWLGGLLLGLSLAASARQRYDFNCAQGGSTVSTQGNVSTTKVLQSFPGATASIFNTGGIVLTTIYSDSAGTPKSNPFTTDLTTGHGFFYADNGAHVDIQCSGTGISVPFTIASDQIINDPATQSVTFVGTSFSSSSTPVATSGVFDLASADIGLCWRNNGNSGDLCFTKNTSDVLNWPSSATIAGSLGLGTNRLTAGGFTSGNSQPALSGTERFANADTFKVRNFANGADLNLLSMNSSDVLALGDAAGVSVQGLTNSGSTSITGNLTVTGALSVTGNVTETTGQNQLKAYSINNVLWVDGIKYTTIQAAITDACASSPVKPVYVPPGTYAQNSAFTGLCSGLMLLGSGRCQADAGTCPTTITTTMTSGKLFDLTNLSDMHFADFAVKSTAGSAADSVFYLDGSQRNVFERIYIAAGGLGFNRGLSLHTSSTSSASVIRNHFEDVFITSLAANGIGCLLDSSDATTKVINSNRFVMVACQGGNNGVGLKVTNSALNQLINENFFYGDEFACANGSGGTGIGIQFTSTATRGMTFVSPNVESCGTGLNKATANTVSFFGGNFSSNGTNVTDSQPAFSQFLGTNVGGTTQTFAITPAGNVNSNALCLGAASCDAGNIDIVSGQALEASGTSVITLLNTGAQLNRQLDVNGQTFKNTGTLTLPTTTGTLARTSGDTFTSTTLTSPTINTGVTNSGTGLMHVRTSSCTTAASANASCNTTVTWPGTWANTSYTATCTADTPTGGNVFVVATQSKSTTQIVVIVENVPTNSAASSATLNCIGVHD